MTKMNLSAFVLAFILFFTGLNTGKSASAGIWSFVGKTLFTKLIDVVVDSVATGASDRELRNRLQSLESEVNRLRNQEGNSSQVQSLQSLISSLESTSLTQGQPSFDCRKASVTVEFTICDDSRLSNIDGKMGIIYWTLRHSLSSSASEKLKQEQLQWLGVRDRNCRPTNATCLLAAYNTRVSQLSSLMK